MSSFLEVYKQTRYKVAGNGPRNIQVLKEALVNWDGEQESDHYGKGKIIDEFQEKMANYLGKEAAVFFPSGTMAQQIALRIWCDEKGLKKVAYHPLSHLEIHEEDGLKELHHIEPILLADKDVSFNWKMWSVWKRKLLVYCLSCHNGRLVASCLAMKHLKRFQLIARKRESSCIWMVHDYLRFFPFMKKQQRKSVHFLIVCMFLFTKESVGLPERFLLEAKSLRKNLRSGNAVMVGI